MVNLVGGLGNQLFGYATGKYLEENHGHKIIFNTWHISRGLTDHGVSIENRGLPGDFVSKPPPPKWARVFYRPYRSRTLGWDPELRNVRKGRIVGGYFQSWKYLEHLKSSSLSPSNILLRRKPTAWLQQNILTAKSEKPLIVHFRRGDYKSVADSMGLLGRDYYEQAFGAVEGQTTSRLYWVFSDEPDLAREFFSKFSINFELIDPPADSEPGESLFLMSQGHGHLISNSTFAWWGAALSTTSNFVIAPRPWLRGFDTPRDLFPEGWNLISHNWAPPGSS